MNLLSRAILHTYGERTILDQYRDEDDRGAVSGVVRLVEAAAPTRPERYRGLKNEK
jgi:hypothetical protein